MESTFFFEELAGALHCHLRYGKQNECLTWMKLHKRQETQTPIQITMVTLAFHRPNFAFQSPSWSHAELLMVFLASARTLACYALSKYSKHNTSLKPLWVFWSLVIEQVQFATRQWSLGHLVVVVWAAVSRFPFSPTLTVQRGNGGWDVPLSHALGCKVNISDCRANA